MTKISPPTGKPTAQVSKGTTKTKLTKASSGDGCCMCLFKIAAFVIIVFGSVAVYMYKYNLYPNFFILRKGDQLALSKKVEDFSTTLCQQYDVSLYNQKADIFLIDGHAEISRNNHEIVSLTEKDYINSYNYKYFATYLLQGSQIQVKGCIIMDTMDGAEILVIKGDDDWNKWQKGECSNCAKKTVDIQEMDRCIFHEAFDLEYDVTSADNYYVVLTEKKSHVHSESLIFSRLTIIKTVYDLSHVREACFDMTHCKMNLSYASDQDVIIRLHRNERDIGRYVSTTTNCSLRIMFWTGIFGILPAGLILLCSTCFYCCLAMDKKSTKQKKQKEIKQALVDNPNYSINSMNPPSFESVSDPLPSYDSLA